MLTPSQFREKDFKTSGRNGYKSEDVDAFFAEASTSYERMFRENSELVRSLSAMREENDALRVRASRLAEKLDELKRNEDEMRGSLENSRKSADSIVNAARANAAALMGEAQAALDSAKSEAQKIAQETENGIRRALEAKLNDARVKSDEIVAQANDEAQRIIADAKKQAKDIQGVTNRTITSETIMFEMLKREVSEFKSDVLAKYRAHLELLNQLPELAAEKANEAVGAPANAVATEVESAQEEARVEAEADVDDASAEIEEADVATSSAVEESTEQSEAGDACDLGGCCDCATEKLSFDSDFVPDVEFVVEENETEVIEDVVSYSPYEAEVEEEYCEKTDIPFDMNSEPELVFVDEGSEEPVNAFYEPTSTIPSDAPDSHKSEPSFSAADIFFSSTADDAKEKPSPVSYEPEVAITEAAQPEVTQPDAVNAFSADNTQQASPFKRKTSGGGFRINLTAAAAAVPAEGVETESAAIAEESFAPAVTEESYSPETAATEELDNLDSVTTEDALRLFDDEHVELKKRFGVIRSSELTPGLNSDSDDADEDEDDDDDEDDGPLFSFFKRKK